MFDQDVLDCFLQNQLQLFPEEVAFSEEEAEEFLEDACAVVVDSREEVIAYFEDEGVDMSDGDIFDASEVFEIGDGRFLIVEA